jgi:predicted aminopeptidase
VPIEELLSSPATPDPLRTRLEYVTRARDYAVAELDLPDNKSYRSFADLERPYVVWNVFAAPRFSVRAEQWCFPIAGCVVYRGYFSEARAQKFARKERVRGRDAVVSGVPAYSTLGHFDDPVLSSMLGWNDTQLAATLFHELAHQVVYVPNDSEFNEAFATVVEEEGALRWLTSLGRAKDLDRWHLQKQRGAQFTALLLRTRERLKTLYASDLPHPEMWHRKHQTFGQLKFEYEQLKVDEWQGYSGYDNYFKRRLSNADLVPAVTYEACVPGLKSLLDSVDGDFPRFYAAARELAKKSREERHRQVCTAAVKPASPSEGGDASSIQAKVTDGESH